MRENEENVVVGCKQTLIWTIRLISFRKENYWQYTVCPKKSRKGFIVTWTIQATAWTFWVCFPLHSTWLESSNQHLAKVKSQCERALPGDCTASLMALFGAWPAQPVDTIRFRLFRLPGPIWSQFMISDSVHLSPAASSCLPVTRSLYLAGSLSPVPLPSTHVFAVTGLECVPTS